MKVPDGFKRLFYDIETSQGVATVFQIGRKVNIGHDDLLINPSIICICYKWEGIDEVHSLEWADGDDEKMVKRFIEVALMADEIVGHNGDNFDEKWIRTQAMMYGIPMPHKMPSLDTLKKMRSTFRLQSNRLDYAGKIMFGEGKSPMSKQDWHDILIPIIPKKLGFEVELPQSYYDALDKMVKYCKQDVKLLEDVFHKIQPYVKPNQHRGAYSGLGRFTCPHCASKKVAHQRKRYTATGMLRHQMRCKSCSHHFTISNKVWQDKMQEDWNEQQRNMNTKG